MYESRNGCCRIKKQYKQKIQQSKKEQVQKDDVKGENPDLKQIRHKKTSTKSGFLGYWMKCVAAIIIGDDPFYEIH